MAKKTLNVKPTTNSELSGKWGFNPSLRGKLFIRCNSNGIVNWEKASVYNADELIDREKVNIIRN
ncbi:MAG: hypothetical protein A2066_12935 [Bacteroidetes bacterium GWB2_41_8]|nr:MAG: hypothetical protein A2066_12935 [Bacteroidetes bacterium GWB2_41_8]